MVKVIGYKQREREDGTFFFVLVLEGGLEIVQSSESGKMYATSKTTTIPSTFDELQCELLIGTEIKGSIVREHCDPYEYVVKATGEKMILDHRWVYAPDDKFTRKFEEQYLEDNPLLDNPKFSNNGTLETA